MSEEFSMESFNHPLGPETLLPENAESNDLYDLEGEGVVESKIIENQELGIRYKETVIEVSEHRREETGITRIRRRELLPPFPEGFYLDDEGETEKRIMVDWKYGSRYKINGFEKIYDFLTDGRSSSSDILSHTFSLPLYYKGMEEKAKAHTDSLKNDGLFFQKIQPGKRPETAGETTIYYKKLEDGELIDQEKDDKGRIIDVHQKVADFSLYKLNVFPGFRSWTGYLKGPLFIFGRNNQAFRDYLNSIVNNPETEKMMKLGGWADEELILISSDSPKYSLDGNSLVQDPDKKPPMLNIDYIRKIAENTPVVPRGFESLIPVVDHPDIKPLRWCQSEIAIIPTKRSLNVLFFETD